MHRRTREAPVKLVALVAQSTIALTTALHAAEITPSGPPPVASGFRAVEVVDGVKRPWALTWLPDGRAIVTAKAGTLHVLEGSRFIEIATDGLPEVFDAGQGGLMDIAVHPRHHGSTPQIYLTLSTGTPAQNRTILVRGILDGGRLRDVQTLFQAAPAKSGAQHFGSRLLWLPDGTLLMSVGDGGNPPLQVEGVLAREQAQNLESHLGSVLRLTEDGAPALANPLAREPGAQPEIWTYGHRNIQGMARDPSTGRVWASEHGPKGGDELNLLEAGKNYGWPLQTYGRDYRSGEPIGQNSVPGMVDPKVVWTPAHAPSGLAFYTGDRVPAWRGSLFSGGLASEDLRRISLDADGNVTGQESLAIGARVRDVRQGPDGFLYVLTDESNGRLLRLQLD